MSDAEDVRAMEIATKLVETLLSWAATSSIKAIGVAIMDLALQCDNVQDIHAVGELLESLTERDRGAIARGAIARGERWGRESRALSPDEGQKVLRGLTIDQAKVFAERWGYGRDEVISWAMGYSEIHGSALWALRDQDEMAKITGETR
jgi:hypothetical protein